MNNFDNNSTYKAKDCIALIVPNYSEPRDRLYNLSLVKIGLPILLLKTRPKGVPEVSQVFFTKDPVFE